MARDPMKSHYCMTIRYHDEKNLHREMQKSKYLDFERVINDIISTARMMRAHYVCWSIEDDKIGLISEHPIQAAADKMRMLESALSKHHLDKSSSGVTGELGISNEISNSPDTTHGLHIHVYMELQRTIRWSTVVNKWQKNGFKGTHVEVRKGWRETCREYHMGTKNYEEKPSHITHGEWGKWREELGDSYSKEDYFELSASMILAGYNPAQVARRFPTWFIRHGFGVVRLYKTLNHECQCFN